MGSSNRSTRREFFLRGGAALGAGVAATAGAAGLAPAKAGEADASDAADREAIAELHRRFIASVSGGRYGEAAALFTPGARLALGGERASGRAAIGELFARHQRQEAGSLHTAYRRNPLHPRDEVSFTPDGTAVARFHVETEVSTPLAGDCTAAQMARLQGQVADRRWEAGRFDARLVKVAGEWRLASLEYATV
jgi:hypothetical protein